jgi:hypothetical protein
MPPAVFEPTISEGERPKTYALDRAANGIGGKPTAVNNYISYKKEIKCGVQTSAVDWG